MPGSPNACRTGWDEIIVEQIDSRHRPCNFVPRLKIKPQIVAAESPSSDDPVAPKIARGDEVKFIPCSEMFAREPNLVP